MTEPIVRLDGVGKRFALRRPWRQTLLHPRRRDYQTALDSVTLEVRRGEIFGLLGQNGAGKTTLFKILATLVTHDTGTVSVGGTDVVARPADARRRLTPVIPNERSLYWRLSAAENLRLFAALHGLRGTDARRAVDDVVALVGLTDAGAKQVGLLSSGMKQRLLVARALLARPEVLLLDEPTRSLDPVHARDFRRFVQRELAERHGCTILLATHDHHEVADLCTRVGILERGRLLAAGATAELGRQLHIHRFRLWTSAPSHPALGALSSVGHARADGTAWTRLEFDGPETDAEAAALLARLVAAEVPIARFERVELSLADLIERVTRQA